MRSFYQNLPERNKRQKTIVIPQGTLNTDENIIVEVPHYLRNHPTLIARPKPGGGAIAEALPTFDDQYSPRSKNASLHASPACQDDTEDDDSDNCNKGCTSETENLESYENISFNISAGRAISSPNKASKMPDFDISPIRKDDSRRHQSRQTSAIKPQTYDYGIPASRAHYINRIHKTFPSERPSTATKNVCPEDSSQQFGLRRAGGQAQLGYSSQSIPYNSSDFTPLTSRSYTPFSLGVSSEDYYDESSSYVPPCQVQNINAYSSIGHTNSSQGSRGQTSWPFTRAITNPRQSYSVNQSAPARYNFDSDSYLQQRQLDSSLPSCCKTQQSSIYHTALDSTQYQSGFDDSFQGYNTGIDASLRSKGCCQSSR